MGANTSGAQRRTFSRNGQTTGIWQVREEESFGTISAVGYWNKRDFQPARVNDHIDVIGPTYVANFRIDSFDNATGDITATSISFNSGTSATFSSLALTDTIDNEQNLLSVTGVFGDTTIVEKAYPSDVLFTQMSVAGLLQNPTASSTEPATPNVGDYWLDTSVAPGVWKEYNGQTFEAASALGIVENRPYAVLDKMKNGDTISIYCVGDSITFGQLDTGGAATTPYPARLQEHLREYYNNANITVTNTGVSGRQSSGVLNTLQTEVISNSPDLVIYNSGTNDSREANNKTLEQYESNVRQTLEMLDANGIPTIVFGVTPRAKENLDDNGEKRITFFRDALRSVTAEKNLPYIDTEEALLDVYRSGGYAWKQLSDDGSHYSQIGYDLIAGIVFKSIFAFETLDVKAGVKMPLWSQILEQDAAGDTSFAVFGDVDESIAITATVRLWLWYTGREADLVLHATVDNNNSTTQAVTVTNTSISGAAGNTYSTSPVVGITAAEKYYSPGYPIVTEKLIPGLNIFSLTPTGSCRLEAISIYERPDPHYFMPAVNDDETGDAAVEIHAQFYGVSEEVSRARLASPIVLTDGSDPRELLTEVYPTGRGQTYRIRLRGMFTNFSTLHFGQKLDDNGAGYAWRIDFKNTNIELAANARNGLVIVIQTAKGTAVPGFANSGTDIAIDFKSTPTDCEIWMNGVLFGNLGVPLGIGPMVMQQRASGTFPIVIDQVYERGPNCSDTGTDLGEQWTDWTASPPVKNIVAMDGATYTVTAV